MDQVVMEIISPSGSAPIGSPFSRMFEIIMMPGRIREYPLGKNFGGRGGGACSPK